MKKILDKPIRLILVMFKLAVHLYHSFNRIFLHFTLYISKDRLSQLKGILLLRTGSLLFNIIKISILLELCNRKHLLSLIKYPLSNCSSLLLKQVEKHLDIYPTWRVSMDYSTLLSRCYYLVSILQLYNTFLSLRNIKKQKSPN